MGFPRRQRHPLDARADYLEQFRSAHRYCVGAQRVRRISRQAVRRRGTNEHSRAFGLYYTSIQDAGLFEEVADAPYGLFWQISSNPMLFDQPFRTRGDGASLGQRFPFILPVPVPTP